MNRNNSTAKTVTEKKESTLKHCMTLWTKESKKTIYVSGVCGEREDPNKFNVVGFFNGKKKNPNEPDLRIYESFGTHGGDRMGHSKDAVASLWLHTTKDGVQYYTGLDNENLRLVAFLNRNKKKDSHPDINVYYDTEPKAV